MQTGSKKKDSSSENHAFKVYETELRMQVALNRGGLILATLRITLISFSTVEFGLSK